MMKFLRENPTISFGLGLPLALVVIFLALSGIPSLLVAPTQHDVLYATNYSYYNNAQNTMQIAVVGNQVQVNYVGNAQPYQIARLWRFTPATGAVREISLPLPPGLLPNAGQPVELPVAPRVTPIALPELAEVKVNPSSLSPDGYEFRAGSDTYRDRGFPGLFYSSRYRPQGELVKNGRSIRLPNTDAGHYGNAVHFVGWVVSQ